MTYADQLRNLNPKDQEARKKDWFAQNYARKMLGTAQCACSVAANAGVHRISGYVRRYMDDGYEEMAFASALPTVTTGASSWKWYDYHETGTRESRLYREFLVDPYDLALNRLIGQYLVAGIKKLGFTKYKVSIERHPDYYAVYKTVRFVNHYRTITTLRQDPKPVYILKIEIEW